MDEVVTFVLVIVVIILVFISFNLIIQNNMKAIVTRMDQFNTRLVALEEAITPPATPPE